ncbi:VOC family protein [Halomonas sp. WWR20]
MQRLSLGESVLRVLDLDGMQQFFSNTLGLELLLRTPTAACYELGQHANGNSQVLMIIANGLRTPSQHLSLEVSADEFDALRPRLCEGGAHLFEGLHSASRSCAWRVLRCSLPEGHSVAVASIDPRRCSPSVASSAGAF